MPTRGGGGEGRVIGEGFLEEVMERMPVVGGRV